MCGCLAADPPDYSDPAQTPPVLQVQVAEPPITEMIRVSTVDEVKSISFNVPVRSEDAGEPLLAVFYLDYGLPQEEPQFTPTQSVSPSGFEDASRVIDLQWNYDDVEVGCHQLTLVVTHQTNFDLGTFRPNDQSDMDLATWWVNVVDPEGDGNDLEACPRN